jgi:hypothetical protein
VYKLVLCLTLPPSLILHPHRRQEPAGPAAGAYGPAIAAAAAAGSDATTTRQQQQLVGGAADDGRRLL